jgi:hypothetical protein
VPRSGSGRGWIGGPLQRKAAKARRRRGAVRVAGHRSRGPRLCRGPCGREGRRRASDARRRPSRPPDLLRRSPGPPHHLVTPHLSGTGPGEYTAESPENAETNASGSFGGSFDSGPGGGAARGEGARPGASARDDGAAWVALSLPAVLSDWSAREGAEGVEGPPRTLEGVARETLLERTAAGGAAGARGHVRPEMQGIVPGPPSRPTRRPGGTGFAGIAVDGSFHIWTFQGRFQTTHSSRGHLHD